MFSFVYIILAVGCKLLEHQLKFHDLQLSAGYGN